MQDLVHRQAKLVRLRAIGGEFSKLDAGSTHLPRTVAPRHDVGDVSVCPSRNLRESGYQTEYAGDIAPCQTLTAMTILIATDREGPAELNPSTIGNI